MTNEEKINKCVEILSKLSFDENVINYNYQRITKNEEVIADIEYNIKVMSEQIETMRNYIKDIELELQMVKK